MMNVYIKEHISNDVIDSRYSSYDECDQVGYSDDY